MVTSHFSTCSCEEPWNGTHVDKELLSRNGSDSLINRQVMGGKCLLNEVGSQWPVPALKITNSRFPPVHLPLSKRFSLPICPWAWYLRFYQRIKFYLFPTSGAGRPPRETCLGIRPSAVPLSGETIHLHWASYVWWERHGLVLVFLFDCWKWSLSSPTGGLASSSLRLSVPCRAEHPSPTTSRGPVTQRRLPDSNENKSYLMKLLISFLYLKIALINVCVCVCVLV